MFPQVPIHHCILPLCSRRPTFHSLKNPSRVQFSSKRADQEDGFSVDILMTSGENVKDAMRNTNITCPLAMAQNLLLWGHLCPTAPDTMPLHPGITDDVFMLKSLPHLFFIGNQSEFGSSEWKGTKIVSVPSFAKTSQVVIVDSEFQMMTLRFSVQKNCTTEAK